MLGETKVFRKQLTYTMMMEPIRQDTRNLKVGLGSVEEAQGVREQEAREARGAGQGQGQGQANLLDRWDQTQPVFLTMLN